MALVPQLTYKPDFIHSIIAVTDTPQYRFIGFDGNLCAAHAMQLGISLEAYDAGDDMAVVVDGIMYVELGGTVALGGLVTSDSVGRAIANSDVVTNPTWSQCGWVLKAGVIGDIVPIKMP